MARARIRIRNEEDDAPAGDSFMDVICNMVGIIIILIMVAGVRMSRASKVELVDASPALKQLHDLQSQSNSLEEDVVRLTADIEQVQLASAVKFEERRLYAVQAEQKRQEFEAERQKLSASQQADLELARAAASADAELSDLDRAIQGAASGERDAEQIISYPTPISKIVNGKEVHFQLRGDRIAHVPIEKLLDRLPGEMRRQRDRLMHSYEATGSAGPVEGFRMQYVLERDGNYIRLYECRFLPAAPDLGEPIDMALAPVSEFRRTLAAHAPRGTTVTLWTYPDSFGAYRRLKAELYNMGFAIAGRPLPPGQPIGGSPHGSKSAAE